MKRITIDKIDIILIIVLLLALWAILSIQLKFLPVITVEGQGGQCLASLFRSYKIGKLGAVPNLGSFLLDLSENKEAE